MNQPPRPLREPALRETHDVVFVPESPAGGTPRQYRARAYALPGFELLSGTLTVELLDDPHRARFTFEGVVRSARPPDAGDELAAEAWTHDIPAGAADVRGARAWDAAGPLGTALETTEPRVTRLRVPFRRMLRAGVEHPFGYAYEAPVRTVVAAGPFSRTVVCSGWLIFNLPCEALRVDIRLPRGARLVGGTPPGTLPGGAGEHPLIRHDLERLRALEVSQWMVAYRVSRAGVPRWLSTAVQAGATVAGWIRGRAGEGRPARR